MKRKDIHTGKDLTNNDSRYENDINSDAIRSYVFANIDFPLSDIQWNIVNKSFEEYWNNKTGIGGYFYWDEVAAFINGEMSRNFQLVSLEQIEIVTNLMLSKIEEDGGFMD